MVKDVPDLPGPDRGAMWIGMEELLTWQPARDAAKPYPSAPPRKDAA
jgi:NADH-quinone oxidoreductase subunit I